MSKIDDMSSIHVLENENDISLLCKKIKEDPKILEPALKDIMSKIGYPLTVACEYYYVDKVFRDSYYKYFSSKHLELGRTCKRLSFFYGIIEQDTFYNHGNANEELQSCFVGTMVIKPLKIGKIGRTLLDPSKLNIPKCYIRLTCFVCKIHGILRILQM